MGKEIIGGVTCGLLGPTSAQRMPADYKKMWAKTLVAHSFPNVHLSIHPQMNFYSDVQYVADAVEEVISGPEYITEEMYN